MLPVLYNNMKQIIQTEDYVVILNEMNHDARIVRLKDSEHDNMPKWLGDSVGYYEGDTLVVETTNFHPQQGFRGALRHFFFLSDDAIVVAMSLFEAREYWSFQPDLEEECDGGCLVERT